MLTYDHNEVLKFVQVHVYVSYYIYHVHKYLSVITIEVVPKKTKTCTRVKLTNPVAVFVGQSTILIKKVMSPFLCN